MTAASNESTPPQHEEQQYLSLISRVLSSGESRDDRTGTGTLSIFAPGQLRFSLANDQLPLLTTKRVFYRGVVEELLWFMRGETNAKLLQDKQVHIWDGNASKQYLESIGLGMREEGDLGPVYGFQWRHFGAEYVDCHTDYTGKGVDQLKDILEKIKNSPFDRRMIMSAWNPAGKLLTITSYKNISYNNHIVDLKKMALPPCHMFCQFYVSFPTTGRPRLSCMMYQRSCDIGLGVPFNIASYSLLTKMIAHVCEMDAGEFILTMGDAHIYKNHCDALKVQIEREPYPFPKLKIKTPEGGGLEALERMQLEDFELIDYKCHGKIQMAMAV